MLIVTDLSPKIVMHIMAILGIVRLPYTISKILLNLAFRNGDGLVEG